MAKQLLEINKFQNGIITTPDISDTPEESASYSLNIDAVIKDGTLQSLPKNRIKYIYNANSTPAKTEVNIDKIGLIRSDDKIDAVYWDDATKKIHFISEIDKNSTITNHNIETTTTKLDEYPSFTPDDDDSGVSVSSSVELSNVSMQSHSKEIHMGLGYNQAPKWIGYTNHKQFGVKLSTPIIENAEVRYPSSVPFLIKTVILSGSTYGVSEGGSRIWKINSTTGALLANSDAGTFQNLKSITSDGTNLYVLDDYTTSTYKGVVIKVAPSALSTKAKIIGMPNTYPGPSGSGYTDIEYTSTGSKIWVAAHRDNRIVTSASATSDKLLWNFSIPSSNNSVLSSLDNRMPRTSGGGNSTVGSWVSPSPGPGAEVTSGSFGAVTNWVMETFPRSLVKHSSDNGAVYWLCRYSDYSSSPIDGLWNMLWLQKSAQNLSSTSGNDWETKAAKVAAYCEIRTLCLNRIPEGHTDGASVNLTMVEHPGNAGGPTANYSDLKGSADATMDAVNIDSCTLDSGNKLFTNIGSSIQRYSTALDNTFTSLATNGPNNNTLGAKVETSYKVTPSGQDERIGTLLNLGHNISSTVALLRANDTAGIDKVANDFSINAVQTFLIDHSAISLSIAAANTNTGSLESGYEYFYKMSFLYDGFQESNLSTEVFPSTQAANEKNKEITINIADTSQIPKRASDVLLYRAESPTSGATKPDSLYRLVKQLPLDTVWTTSTDGSTGVTSANLTHEDKGDKLASYEANSELPESIQNTLPNYNISAQINNYHFIGNCKHPNLDDASTYVFRSKISKFDTFDWLVDFVKLPTVPTTLIAFNGRIYAFDKANTYKIEPNNLYVEDIFEGVGCLNDDAVVSTDFGMFFADDNNLYHLTSSTASPIGESIVRGSDATGTGNSITAWQNRDKSYYTRAVYDPIRRSVYFSFRGTDNNYYAWAWNVPRRRWDLASFNDDLGTLMPKGVCTLDSGEILWASDDSGDSSKQKLKHYIGHASNKRDWTWVSKSLTMGNDTQQKRIKDILSTSQIKINKTTDGTFPSEGNQLPSKIESDKGAFRLRDVNTKVTQLRLRLDSNTSTDSCEAVSVLFKTKRSAR
jgi:hypothetical protein